MADPSIAVTLDIGGSAAKASAYDAVRGLSLGSAAMPYSAPHTQADPGMFDPDEWWLAATGALRLLRDRLDVPAGCYIGITVSAIRIPFVLLDGDREVVMPSLLNRDKRAATQIAGLTAAAGADEIYRRTGHWPAPEFGLSKLLWVRESHADAWKATRILLQLHDWFIYKLSGVIASERTSAAMSQMLDVTAGTWAEPLLSAVDVPRSVLPELRPAGAVAGGLLPVVAGETGFAPGTPVHLGGGDTHMSAESAGASDRAVPVVVAGTTAPVQIAVPRSRLPHPTADAYPLLVSEHVTPGRWALETNAGFTGGVVALLDGLEDQTGADLRDALVRRGMTVRDGDDLAVLAGNPFFGPEGWAYSPPPTVIGLRPEHSGVDVHRASLRAISFAIRSILGNLTERSGVQPPFVVATGGMSRNAEWAQLLADVAGAEVRVRPLDQIAGRAGAVLIAGAETANSIRQDLGYEDVFTPHADLAAALDVDYLRYKALYRAAQLEPTTQEAGDSCSRSLAPLSRRTWLRR